MVGLWTLDWFLRFAGAAAVLVQVLALDRRFRVAGAAAVLVRVQMPALDRRFVLRDLFQLNCRFWWR